MAAWCRALARSCSRTSPMTKTVSFCPARSWITRCRARRIFRNSSARRNEVLTPNNPLGVKGAGEAGTVGALAAVINAIVDALVAVWCRAYRNAGDAGADMAHDQKQKRFVSDGAVSRGCRRGTFAAAMMAACASTQPTVMAASRMLRRSTTGPKLLLTCGPI